MQCSEGCTLGVACVRSGGEGGGGRGRGKILGILLEDSGQPKTKQVADQKSGWDSPVCCGGLRVVNCREGGAEKAGGGRPMWISAPGCGAGGQGEARIFQNRRGEERRGSLYLTGSVLRSEDDALIGERRRR